MIALKGKSANKNGLGCDLNSLHPLKLVPEAVLSCSSPAIACPRCFVACFATPSPLLTFADDAAY